jgi:hypothetical protein
MRFHCIKQYLKDIYCYKAIFWGDLNDTNEIFWLKQYFNKLVSFIYIHSAQVISPIFNLNGEQ